MWNEEIFNAFWRAMRSEWLIAREDNEPFHSLHEGYAVLLEEVEELEHQVFLKLHYRNRREIIKECIQIAAMAFCVASECTNATEFDLDNYRVE